MVKFIRRLLKNRRGSPLVEEGMLLGLAAVTFTVILSVVAGLLEGLNKPAENIASLLSQGLGSFAQQLGEILDQIAKAIGIG